MEIHRYTSGMMNDANGEYIRYVDYEEMLQAKNQAINKLCVLLKHCAAMIDWKYVVYETGEPFVDFIQRTVAQEETEERSRR